MKIISIITLLLIIISCSMIQKPRKVSQNKNINWELIHKRGPAFKTATAFNDKVSDCTGVVNNPRLNKKGEWIYKVTKMACPYHNPPYHELDEGYLEKMVVSPK